VSRTGPLTCDPKAALPGLDLGIHVLETKMAQRNEGVAGRVKPGHCNLGVHGDPSRTPWNKPGHDDFGYAHPNGAPRPAFGAGNDSMETTAGSQP
jgi:hypothetical protein